MSADFVPGPWWPYLLVIGIGFLPSEIWRVLGVFLSRGMRPDAEILVWARAVATTLLAGVVAKLLLAPTGALAAVPPAGRLGSLIAGFTIFWLAGRSVILGVLAGEAALVAAAWWGGASGG